MSKGMKVYMPRNSLAEYVKKLPHESDARFVKALIEERQAAFPDPQTAATMSEIIMSKENTEERAYYALLANLPFMVKVYTKFEVVKKEYTFSDFFNETFISILPVVERYDKDKSKITTWASVFINTFLLKLVYKITRRQKHEKAFSDLMAEFNEMGIFEDLTREEMVSLFTDKTNIPQYEEIANVEKIMMEKFMEEFKKKKRDALFNKYKKMMIKAIEDDYNEPAFLHYLYFLELFLKKVEEMDNEEEKVYYKSAVLKFIKKLRLEAVVMFPKKLGKISEWFTCFQAIS